MAAIRKWWRSIAPRTPSDVEEEFRSTLDAYQDDLIRRGLPEDEAGRRARIELGRSAAQNENYRNAIGLRPFDELGGDIRYSVRGLLKNPGFSVVAILSLALGIGATTAVFSVVYAILIDPFPYANSDRMAHMWVIPSKGDRQFFGITGSQWQQLRKSPVVEDAFIMDNWNLTVTGSDLPEDVHGAYLSSNGFNFLGVPPVLGRGLQPSDAIDGHDPESVAVLGYTFWQRHFHADPSVVGKTIQLVRNNFTIVGVAAPSFTWGDADVYLPLKITGDQIKGFFPEIRLKPGVTHTQADAALQPLIQQFARETPRHFPADTQIKLHVADPDEHFVKDLGPTLYLLFGAVLLLLLIGCGNVSILLLARATSRQHEFAVRSAIGASRRRIIRQLLTEALVLSLTGAGVGLVLAYRTVSVIVANLPQFSFPREAAIQINVPVLLFSIAVAVGTGILFGLSPAWQLSRPEVSQVMQASSRKTIGSVRGRRTHNGLIVGQIALSVLMLAGASAAIEGFLRVAHTRLGYDPHNVMSVGIPIHDGTYKTWPERAAYLERLHSKVAEVPGVTVAAVSSNATPPANGFNTKFEILGKPTAQDQTFRFNLVSHEYFPALRIPLVQGRMWDSAEEHRAAALVVVNQTLARRYFPNGDAVGHSIKVPELVPQPPYLITAPGSDGWMLIVGVIADKLDDGLSRPILPEAFVPFTVAMAMGTQILVRSQGQPLVLLHSVSAAVNSIDRDQQVSNNVRDLEHWISELPEYARGHLVSWLFGAFAALALALAAVGIFSVVSYTVVQRTNEFGIRIALGAKRRHVLWIVCRNIGITVSSGLLAGLLIFVTLQRILTHWIQSSSSSPFILVPVAALFILCAVSACIIPALRAVSIDPMRAVRYE
jgi:predicted permease